jgi:Domain of unknown function (DUF4062)
MLRQIKVLLHQNWIYFAWIENQLISFKKILIMPKNITTVSVFVASPSDVQDERNLLEGLTAELNMIWSANLGIRFELIRWETHVHPSFGDDPQSVINNQVDADYDVFVGILWGRYGTPTPRADSGTKEEFERAYARFKRTGNSPEIMIYFKDAPIAPSKIDTDQLQKVKDFRHSLSAQGGLLSVFEDSLSFESSVRSHLSALAQKFSSKKVIPNPDLQLAVRNTAIVVTPMVDSDDFGYLDYIEVHSVRSTEMNAALTAIQEATLRIGQSLSIRTVEITQVNKLTVDPSVVRKYIRLCADDMNAYAFSIEKQISILKSSSEGTFMALSHALVLYQDFAEDDTTQLRHLFDILETTVNAAEGAKCGLLEMRTSTQGLPRIASELNKAKRLVVEQLDSLITEIDNTTNTVKNILDSISMLLKQHHSSR